MTCRNTGHGTEFVMAVIHLPPEIDAEVGELVSKMQSANWHLDAAVYDAVVFGNWYVDLTRGAAAVRLVKDRSQYMIHGPGKDLEASGLWKAFNSLEEFQRAIAAWAA